MAKDLENTMINNNLYIMTTINSETTMDALIKLTQWVDALPIRKNNTIVKPKKITDDTVYVIGAKIFSPYEAIPSNRTVLNVYINCNGGTNMMTDSILTLFNIASSKGTIIKTYNLNNASSNASRIAVSGTKGYRYMAQNAYNFIHYGNISVDVNRASDLEYLQKRPQRHLDLAKQTYKDNTKLTDEEINMFLSIENSGMLTAQECLEKGLCDWIITNDGRFINEIKDMQTRQRG